MIEMPPLLPPLLLMLIFQKYVVIASCGYKNYCQKVIIDEDTTVFYEIGRIGYAKYLVRSGKF